MRRFLAICSIAAVAACGGMGGGGDAGMAYGVPDGSPLVYDRADSLSATVTVPGMGSIDLDFDQSMTLNALFGPSASGATVELTISDFSGRIRNPAMGTTRADAGDVSGTLAFILDASGRPEITAEPAVSGAARAMFRPAGLAHEFLPRLPARPVLMGDRWTDTIEYSASGPEGDLGVTWIATFTVVGEDDFRGNTVTRVESEGEYAVTTSGEMQGMYVEQELSGSESGFFLWDPDGRRVVFFESIREMDGSVHADVAPGPMEMSGRSLIRTVLRVP